jgi:hypothetical protein
MSCIGKHSKFEVDKTQAKTANIKCNVLLGKITVHVEQGKNVTKYKKFLLTKLTKPNFKFGNYEVKVLAFDISIQNSKAHCEISDLRGP